MERLTELKYYITKLDAKIENMQERIDKMAFDDKEEVGIKFLASTVSYLKELKEYKQLEEQGLLLRLPCKVGTSVYMVAQDCGGDILDCMRGDCEGCPYLYSFVEENKFEAYMFEDIGKTVFITQAEAEQKLKEMESD